MRAWVMALAAALGAAVVGDRIFVPGGANVQGFGAVTAHEVFTPPAERTCN